MYTSWSFGGLTYAQTHSLVREPEGFQSIVLLGTIHMEHHTGTSTANQVLHFIVIQSTREGMHGLVGVSTYRIPVQTHYYIIIFLHGALTYVHVYTYGCGTNIRILDVLALRSDNFRCSNTGPLKKGDNFNFMHSHFKCSYL